MWTCLLYTSTRFAADLNTLGIPAAVFPARDYVLRPIEGTAREYEYRRLAVLGELCLLYTSRCV